MSRLNRDFVRSYNDYLGARRCCGIVGAGGVGAIGPAGVDGPRGPAGVTGYTGPYGPTGARGCRGYPGTAAPLFQTPITEPTLVDNNKLTNFGGDGILLQAGNYAINWTIVFNTNNEVGNIQGALCLFQFGSLTTLPTYLYSNNFYVNNVLRTDSKYTTLTGTDQIYISDPTQIQVGCYQINDASPGNYNAYINAVFIPVL
jgi:hypothetical protein